MNAINEKFEMVSTISAHNRSVVIETDIFNSLVIEFLDVNKSVNVNHHSFGQIIINNDFIPLLKSELEKIDYTFHSTNELFYFYSEHVIGRFNYNNNGLDEGYILYTRESGKDLLDTIVNKVADNSRKIEIRWYTDANGNYYNIVEMFNDVVFNSMYPFITMGVDNYINDFLNSKSSILVLLGKPGTGKTSFIRYLMSKMGKKAYLTYNHDLFKQDEMFAQFASSKSSGAFIIEDADVLLKSRESGNELMQKFLQLGEGVIKLNGKKLIFSTNLPSTKDIDEALLRQGRTYDVLEFRPMTFKEANIACKDLKLEPLLENKEYKLTEIFNRGKMKEQKRVGFY